MTERARIILSSVGIMAAVSLSTAAIAIYVLYGAAREMHTARLREVVESGARLIEAVARFDARHSADVPGGASAATLSQIVEAHRQFEGFGETGEFILARQEGDQIAWLLPHRHEDAESPPPTPLASPLAEPMRRALRGESGTIVARDYRGVEVLAAYEKLRGLGWGAVAKIDIAEIRRPFVRAGLLVSGIALFAIAVGVGFILRTTSPLIRKIEARNQELRTAHQRLRIHSSEASLAVERERRRLAVDLHDGLGQLLALAKIKLGLLQEKTEVGGLASRLHEIEGLIAEAHQQTRAMTSELCPPVLYEVGLVAALRWLAEEMERRYGLCVSIEVEGECAGLDETMRISLFRGVSELLINVAKHAKTDKARVRVLDAGPQADLAVNVEDQGAGFDSSSGSAGYGLFSLRERLHHLGGSITIASTPGVGTVVSIRAPRSAPAGEPA